MIVLLAVILTQNIITEVLGDDNDVGKFEEAMGFARLTVSTFRTEERRKVYNHSH